MLSECFWRIDVFMSLTLWPGKLRSQGEFTEVAFVAIQIYQVTYCSQEIANLIYCYGYAKNISKIVCSQQLEHLSEIFKEVVSLRERLNTFSCCFWEPELDLPLWVWLGKRRRWLQEVVRLWVYLISSGSSFHHQIPSASSGDFAVTIALKFLGVV